MSLSRTSKEVTSYSKTLGWEGYESEDEGGGRRKNEVVQLDPTDLWKTPDKGTGKVGRLGQVLWDGHRPGGGGLTSDLSEENNPALCLWK